MNLSIFYGDRSLTRRDSFQRNSFNPPLSDRLLNLDPISGHLDEVIDIRHIRRDHHTREIGRPSTPIRMRGRQIPPVFSFHELSEGVS